MSKIIKVLHLIPMTVCEQNIDFGGRELLSTEFNNFLDKRFNENIC